MKNSVVVSLGILAFAGGSFGIARSQATPAAAVTPNPAASALSDSAFIRAVTQSNDMEIDAARYVVQSTKSPTVRDFATQMIADHSTANVQLQVAARNANVALPQRDPSGKAPEALASLRGPQLDRAYLTGQVAAHRTALDVLTSYSTNGKNAALQTYAGNLVPGVQKHYSLAQTLLAALPPAARMPAASASVAPIPAGGVPGNTNPNGGSMVPPTSPSPQGSGSPNPQPSVGVPTTPGPVASPASGASRAPNPGGAT